MGPRFVSLVQNRTELLGNRPPLFDAFEQGFPGAGGGENQRHAVGDRVLDMLDRPGPLDLSERSVDGYYLLVGNDAGDKQAHGLAVLSARDVERKESAAPDHLFALGKDWDIGGGRTTAGQAPDHDWRPSWSVSTSPLTIETKSGLM